MPDNATDTIESQIEELQQVAAKRLILVVLDGLFWFCVATIISRFYLRHVGRGARAAILMYRPWHCVKASGGTDGLCSFVFLLLVFLLLDNSHQGYHAERI